MLINKTKIKVRYGETDQMGIVNNAVYPSWFEIGRTEMFNEIRLPYSGMEKNGLMLPLSELQVKYMLPARYDETLTITTEVKDMPAARITFDYQIHNKKNVLIARGKTIHAFLNAKTQKPGRIPDNLKEQLKQYFAV